MKEMKNNRLDELFRSGLEDQEMAPPSAAWAQMESLLDARQATEPKKKRRAIVWFRAAAVLLPLLLIGAWWFVQKDAGKALTLSPKAKLPQGQMDAKPNSPQKSAGESSGAIVQAENKPAKRNFKKSLPERTNRFPGTGQQPDRAPQIPTGEALAETVPKKLQHWEEPRIKCVEPPEPLPELAQTNTDTNTVEIARIELRPGKKISPSFPETDLGTDAEIAQVEWKTHKKVRLPLTASLAKIKSADLGKIPTVADARESISNWLGFRK